MASMGSVIGNVTSGGMTTMTILIWILVAVGIITAVIGTIFFFVWRKRRWNLKVEIKLIRSDGAIVNGEWGQGFYDSKKGVVMIKRPGGKPIPMKIFDTRRYMQGSDLITVIQAGPEDFRPVLNKSWSKHSIYIDDETRPVMDENGNLIVDQNNKQIYHKTEIKESVINMQTETGKNKAWKAAWEEAAKNAYTIRSFLREHAAAVSVSVVVISCFVGFAILWTKLSTVCG